MFVVRENNDKCNQYCILPVSLAAARAGVTQYFPPPRVGAGAGGGALRDSGLSGCEGD